MPPLTHAHALTDELLNLPLRNRESDLLRRNRILGRRGIELPQLEDRGGGGHLQHHHHGSRRPALEEPRAQLCAYKLHDLLLFEGKSCFALLPCGLRIAFTMDAARQVVEFPVVSYHRTYYNVSIGKCPATPPEFRS